MVGVEGGKTGSQSEEIPPSVPYQYMPAEYLLSSHGSKTEVILKKLIE